MNSTPRLSVIIATYNRAHILQHCLQAFVEQTANPDAFEVIVVNNNSKDHTDDVVQSFTGKIQNLTLIHEKNQGLSYARNAGMAAAQGEWAAYIDDDAKAHTNWVEVIFREIERNNFDCFGGPYLAWHYYDSKPPWFSEEWETSIVRFNSYGIISPLSVLPTGGNCVIKLEILRSLGGFATSLGMKGETCAYGEETKLFNDMRDAGFRLGCVPDLLIDHCVLPYKYTLKWRILAAYRHGQATPGVEPYFAKLSQFPKRVVEVIKQLILFPYHVFMGIRQKHLWQRILLDSAKPLLRSLGCLQSCIAILLRNMTTSKTGQGKK